MTTYNALYLMPGGATTCRRFDADSRALAVDHARRLAASDDAWPDGKPEAVAGVRLARCAPDWWPPARDYPVPAPAGKRGAA